MTATTTEIATALHAAADGLVAEVTPETSTDDLLDRLRSLRVVFDAVDAGNASQGRDPGALRPHRLDLFHALADRRVPRSQIAEAAGVTENAIGFAFKGNRRGRTGPAPAAESNGAERTRRPRPGT